MAPFSFDYLNVFAKNKLRFLGGCGVNPLYDTVELDFMLQIEKLLRLERRITALTCAINFAINWRTMNTGKYHMMSSDDQKAMASQYNKLYRMSLFRELRLAKISQQRGGTR